MTLNITLHKVRAHSNIYYNDLADVKAKKGLDILPMYINLKFVPDATMSPFWDSIGTIDRDIRKFSIIVTDAHTFDSFINNSKL